MTWPLWMEIIMGWQYTPGFQPYWTPNGRLCPYPNMSDYDLDDYELTFSVPNPTPYL